MTARSSTTSTTVPTVYMATAPLVLPEHAAPGEVERLLGLASSQQPTPALPTNEPGGKRNGPTPLAGTPPRRGHRPSRIAPQSFPGF